MIFKCYFANFFMCVPISQEFHICFQIAFYTINKENKYNIIQYICVQILVISE